MSMCYRCALPFLLACLCGPALAQNVPPVPAPEPAPAPTTPPKQPDTITTPAPNQPEKLTPAETPVKPDYPSAIWIPANPRNYSSRRTRTPQDITMVVVHDIEGSAEGAISWFQNPRARASSHYVVNSTTGQVWQMVKEENMAWHAGNSYVNFHSIGIEHEGYAYRPGFFNPVEYEASAKLIRYITGKYNIPRDRQHIISHAEVPSETDPTKFGGSSGHTDPGPYWDWDTLMTLIRNDARLLNRQIPAVIHPGELLPATVNYANTGDDLWTANNHGAEDANVAAKGGIYLGTWGPALHVSPFFNYKFWTSDRMASSVVNGDTAPGGTGTFTFSLLGPRKLGKVTEQFRPVLYPAAPRSPVYFGDVLTTTVDVRPWDLEFTAKGAGPAPAGWNAKDGVSWRKTGTGAAFAWKPALPISGTWDVYARWTPGPTHTRKAQYQVVSSEGASPVIPVDQRRGGGWVKLGRYRFDDPKAVTVRLSAQGAPGVVVADAVRFVGPFEK